MNKLDFIKSIVEDTGLSKKDVELVHDALFKNISSLMRQGERYQIVNFGTFKVLTRAPRTSRYNPKAPEKKEIQEKKLAVWEPSKSLIEEVQN